MPSLGNFGKAGGGKAVEDGNAILGGLQLAFLLGGIFLVGQGTEYWHLFQTGVDLGTNMFSTTFFTLTGFHGLHVLLGLIALLIFEPGQRATRKPAPAPPPAPPMKVAPDVSVSRPARQCSSVDFPDPDGPMIALNLPVSNDTVTPSSAWTWASPIP